MTDKAPGRADADVRDAARLNPIKTKPPWLGLPVDRLDVRGKPIHYGDLLYFDEREWGAPDCYFRVEFKAGDTIICGCLGDLSEYVTVVQKWDGGEP